MESGVFVGSWISKHYGRRWCVCLITVYALCSTAVLVSSESSAHKLTGRSIHFWFPSECHLIYIDAHGTTGTLSWLTIKCSGLLVTGIVRATSEV